MLGGRGGLQEGGGEEPPRRRAGQAVGFADDVAQGVTPSRPTRLVPDNQVFSGCTAFIQLAPPQCPPAPWQLKRSAGALWPQVYPSPSGGQKADRPDGSVPQGPGGSSIKLASVRPADKRHTLRSLRGLGRRPELCSGRITASPSLVGPATAASLAQDPITRAMQLAEARADNGTGASWGELPPGGLPPALGRQAAGLPAIAAPARLPTGQPSVDDSASGRGMTTPPPKLSAPPPGRYAPPAPAAAPADAYRTGSPPAVAKSPGALWQGPRVPAPVFGNLLK